MGEKHFIVLQVKIDQEIHKICGIFFVKQFSLASMPQCLPMP